MPNVAEPTVSAPPDAGLLLLLDVIGHAVRGRHEAGFAPSMLAAARALGVAAGNGGVFGDTARYTPAGAAFLNAAFASAQGGGACVVAAALAAAEEAAASGAEVLAAVRAGCDTMRQGGAVLGAAAAAARVFRLDEPGLASALGIARQQSPAQPAGTGAAAVAFAAGWAAMGGLTAAVLAREGLRVPGGEMARFDGGGWPAPVTHGPADGMRAFLALAAPVLGEAPAARLANAVLALPAAPGVTSLARLSAPAPGARLAGD